MNTKTYIVLLIIGIIVIAILWGHMNYNEKFTPTVDTLEKIRNYIISNPTDYNAYLQFLVSSNIYDTEYLSQPFYYGCIALKKLDLIIVDHMKKLLL